MTSVQLNRLIDQCFLLTVSLEKLTSSSFFDSPSRVKFYAKKKKSLKMRGRVCDRTLL